MSENRALAGLLLVLVGFLAAAGWFASEQAIWVDETTQIRGLTLPFAEQLRWLTGQFDAGLGVPPDRMPPLSYWIGGLWAAVFGLSETSMRLLGITAMLTAAPALVQAGRELGGTAGGLFLPATLYTAPGLIIMAGEIRTYPIFFCLAAWALWAYTRALLAETRRERTRATSALTVLAILMSYAHFFGVVAGACLFAGLFLNRLLRRMSVLPVLLAFAVTALGWVGLAPFVMAAVGISSGGADPTSPEMATAVRDAVRFAIRLFADPVFLANRTAFLLLGLSVGIMAVLAIWRGASGDTRWRAAAFAMAVPGVVSIVGLGTLNQLIAGFNPLQPNYSIWLVPFLFGFLALGFAGQPDVSRRLTALAAVGVVAANLMATATLLRHAPLYIHGPGEWLAERIDAPESVLLIHDDRDGWGHSYFPVFHLEGERLTQVVRRIDGSHFEFSDMTVEPIGDFDTFREDYDRVYRVRTIPLTGAERAGIASGKFSCADTLARALGTSAAPEAYCGMIGASLTPEP